MSQMVTNSHVTGTNLSIETETSTILILFRLEWFGMNKIRQNIPESELCFCFLFGIRIGTALTTGLPLVAVKRSGKEEEQEQEDTQ